MSILTIDFAVGVAGHLHVVESIHVNSEEALQFQDQAMQAIEHCAACLAQGAKTTVKRITYADEEGDWCTLSLDSFADALEFTRKDGDFQVLLLHVNLEQPQPQPEAVEQPQPEKDEEPQPGTPPKKQRTTQQEEAPVPAEPASTSLEAVALKELCRLGNGTDPRTLVPRLAGVALKIVEEAQRPELFCLLDTLFDFQEGRLQADQVPGVMPQLTHVLGHIPEDVLMPLAARFREEAEKVATQAREELQNKEVEVHLGIVCDGCDHSLVGPRFKSLELDNYDLCKACFDSKERDSAHWVRVRSEVFGTVESFYYGQADGPDASPVHHRIQCDGCEAVPIVGKRFRSLDRADYDLCEACLAATMANPETASEKFQEVTVMAVAGDAALMALGKAEELAAVEAREREERKAQELAKKEKEEKERQSIVADMMTAMDEKAVRETLQALLLHSNGCVRNAAMEEAISRVGNDAAVEQEATKEQVEQVAQQQPPQPQTVETCSPQEPQEMEDVSAPVQASEIAAAVAAAQPAQPSARVLASEHTLGVEAWEDESVRGDITEELQEVIVQAGAKQAFRVARVVVPVNAGVVPVCSKVVLANDGEVPWPASTVLSIVSGDALGFPGLALGAVAPGQGTEVEMDLALPAKDAAAAERSVWALVDAATGKSLGPLLIFESFWAQ